MNQRKDLSLSQAPTVDEINLLVELYNTRSYAELEKRAGLLIGQYPGFGFGWKLLGGALQMQGKDAIPAFQTVTQLMPDDAESHFNLGVALGGSGRLDDAVTSYRKAISLKSDYAEAHSNLGNSFKDLGQFKDAESSCRKVIELMPKYAYAHFNLGSVLVELGSLEEAVASFRRAVELKPGFAVAYNNLGNVLKELGQLDEAAASYRRAVEFKPDFAVAHNNRGNVLIKLGQLDEALASYRRAVELESFNAVTHNNLGNVLKELGQIDAAISSYRKAVEIEPGFAVAHNNLALCCLHIYKLDDAEDASLTALKINPNLVSALLTLGNIYKETGRIDEAIACCRRAIELDPNSTAARSNLLYLLSFSPGLNDSMILAEVKNITSSFNSIPTLEASHFGRNRKQGGRLRVGYVSPDFRNHCQSFFTIPLLSNHDHAQFEVFCYAQLAKEDDITRRLRTYADGWRNTHLKDDQQVAEMIINDKIDILVDLTMHMSKARPKLFASKPAPVQVAWLAYPGTTGIKAIDYRLTDPWLNPPGDGDDCYSEQSIRLPDTFWCYDPLVLDLKPNALPAQANGYITFGCLNNFSKVSDDTLRRWGKIMARVPSSRLILLSPAGRHRKKVFDLLGHHGIDAERIELVELQPRLKYLRTYHRIDMCLDTLPYNGHTTSLDAYWMGVPVVTQVGNSIAGRAGWSQLNNLGLTELATFNEKTFVEIAVELANDLSRLSQFRQSLRGKMETSPLMDGKRFAKAIENVYSEIWQRG